MTADVKKVKVLRGVVVSDGMDKTVVVEVSRVKTHPLYGKKFATHQRYKAHDAENVYKKGDEVEMSSCRPYSKDKKFIVVNKINK